MPTVITKAGQRIIDEAVIKAAASTLEEKLFRFQKTGYIGIGAGKLIVFLKHDRHPQHMLPFEEWEGYPVEWHFGCGDAVASANTTTV